jgi:2OG-Fe(II) oxygenase superfamily
VSAARDHAGSYRDIFLGAEPFLHVVIDNFFEPAFAERLLAESPKVRSKKPAIAENGTVGGKAVNSRIGEIGPARQWSGIPDLLLDPKMYGGGVHDNLHGEELDPHVDFNYDEAIQLHRRLNLIVYLNNEWMRAWGGALEIHSHPRKPFENRVASYDPLFNRCVMFETNERSWHVFRKSTCRPTDGTFHAKSISIRAAFPAAKYYAGPHAD